MKNKCEINIELNGKKVPKELVELIIKRLEAMPKNIKFAVLGAVLTQEDIIKEICDNSTIGREILKIEIGYYRDLLRN